MIKMILKRGTTIADINTNRDTAYSWLSYSALTDVKIVSDCENPRVCSDKMGNRLAGKKRISPAIASASVLSKERRFLEISVERQRGQ